MKEEGKQDPGCVANKYDSEFRDAGQHYRRGGPTYRQPGLAATQAATGRLVAGACSPVGFVLTGLAAVGRRCAPSSGLVHNDQVLLEGDHAGHYEQQLRSTGTLLRAFADHLV